MKIMLKTKGLATIMILLTSVTFSHYKLDSQIYIFCFRTGKLAWNARAR